MKLKKNFFQYVLTATLLMVFLLLYFLNEPFRESIQKAAKILTRGEVKLLRDYLLSYGFWAPLISGLLMVFQSVVAPLPAFVITFTNGLLFGMWWGALLSWSSAMVGAAVCFYLARLFGRPLVEKIVGETNLEFADSFFKRYGRYAVFLARLIPVISFDVVSYASGLTAIGFLEFFIATGIGQLPATIVYSYLGESMTGTIKIIFWAFVIVISFIVIGVILKSYLTSSTAEEG